jgi:hypothetical protein
MLLMHTNFMKSPTHHAYLVKRGFREMGIGMEVGPFQRWPAATVVTQQYGRTGTKAFLTGVAFTDNDGDHFYDVGEGLGGVKVKIVDLSQRLSYALRTNSAGGYQRSLPPGNFTVTFSGRGLVCFRGPSPENGFPN